MTTSQVTPDRDAPIPLFYWDKKRNFGDLIGPWLVRLITGRPTLNVRGRQKGPALATVGSIIGMFDRPGLDVWGSGLMARLDAETVARLRVNRPRRLHAVRGWRTWRELTKTLGWDVPKVYGDPALLLPRFHAPGPTAAHRKIVVCPHFTHKALVRRADGDDIAVLDVQGDEQAVVDAIAGASACISSSLHGLIVAQAYEVPWVWLEFEGRKLGGTNFKFEDFFTVLERAAVRHVRCAPADAVAANLRAMAEQAMLPKSKFSFDELLDAFPISSY